MLDTPVPIDVTQELWVGYYVNAQTGYPADVDNGPAIDGYGNMMNYGGWQTLLEINDQLNYNWNIATHLQTLSGVTMPLGKSVDPYQNATGMTMSMTTMESQYNNVFTPASGTRDLVGYNIYRSVAGGDYEMIDYTTAPPYLDTEADPEIGSVYSYMVNGCMGKRDRPVRELILERSLRSVDLDRGRQQC